MKSDDSPPDSSLPSGPGLPASLLRNGWNPHRFADSNVVVVLPRAKAVAFGTGGRLFATFSRGKPDFTATLHSNKSFTNRRELALDFVSNLAIKKKAEVVDIATYRYFADPLKSIEGSREHSFWVIGIPGAVVVVSLTRDVGAPFSDAIESIRQAIPAIIGELL